MSAVQRKCQKLMFMRSWHKRYSHCVLPELISYRDQNFVFFSTAVHKTPNLWHTSLVLANESTNVKRNWKFYQGLYFLRRKNTNTHTLRCSLGILFRIVLINKLLLCICKLVIRLLAHVGTAHSARSSEQPNKPVQSKDTHLTCRLVVEIFLTFQKSRCDMKILRL